MPMVSIACEFRFLPAQPSTPTVDGGFFRRVELVRIAELLVGVEFRA
jgi:hypothetical protein